MSKERETQILSSLRERGGTSLELRLVKELCALRLEKYKNDLVGNESEQVRGRAKEMKDMLKFLGAEGLDNS